MKKKKEIQSAPKMVILNEVNDQIAADKETFKLINASMVDASRYRNYDCLFISETKCIAKELSYCLRKNQGYETEKPYHGEDGWIIHAVKKIVQSDLESTINAAREEAANHASDLFDWMVEVDK